MVLGQKGLIEELLSISRSSHPDPSVGAALMAGRALTTSEELSAAITDKNEMTALSEPGAVNPVTTQGPTRA